MTDIAFDGTIEGIKAANVAATIAAADNTPSVARELLINLRKAERLARQSTDRSVSIRDLALIGIDSKLGRIERLHEKAAEAATRQADALEVIAALLAACTGTARAFCPGEAVSSPAVNYLRTGDGKTFRCDETPESNDE